MTMSTEQRKEFGELLQLLKTKFDDGLVKTKDRFSYISHALVTEKLNELTPDWSMEVKEVHTYLVDGVIHCAGVTVAMTINGVTRTEMGGPSVRMKKVDGRMVEYLEPFALEAKNAMSDAVKRCAMRFGVALYIWDKLVDAEYDDDVNPDREAAGGQPVRESRSAEPAPARQAAAPAPARQQQPRTGVDPASVPGVTRGMPSSQAAAPEADADVYPYAKVSNISGNDSMVAWLNAHGFNVTDYASSIKAVRQYGKEVHKIDNIIVGTGDMKEFKGKWSRSAYPSNIVDAAAHYIAIEEKNRRTPDEPPAGDDTIMDDEIPF